MVALDNIRIEMNPDQRYFKEMIGEIVRTEDWNKTRDETEIWKSAKFEVYEYYIAFDNETDQAVGSIALTMDKSANGDPDDDLFYIGNFYTRPEYRSIGLGMKLFNVIMERAKGTNVNLNAVAKVADFYDQKFGFSYSPQYMHIQAKMDTARMHPKGDIDCLDYAIVDIADANWDSIVAFDRSISSRERSSYLKAWTCYKDSITKVALTPTGTVVGFACIRPQIKNRLSIGPFYAENKEVAEILLNKVLSRPDLKSFEQVWIRFPETNKDAMSILESIVDGEFLKVKASKSQFNKRLIEADAKKVYSIMEAGHSLA